MQTGHHWRLPAHWGLGTLFENLWTSLHGGDMGRQQRPLRYRLEGWLGWSGSIWSPPKDLPSFSKAPSTCFHIFQSSSRMLQKYTEILFHQLMSLMSRYLFSCSLEYQATSIMHPKPWMWVMWVWYVDALMHRAFNWWRSVNSQAAFATWPRLAKETVGKARLTN